MLFEAKMATEGRGWTDDEDLDGLMMNAMAVSMSMSLCYIMCTCAHMALYNVPVLYIIKTPDKRPHRGAELKKVNH